LQSIGEFWQAMDNKPRAALNYTVTISVDVFAPLEVAAVTEKVFHTGRKIDEPTGPALAEQSREEHVVRLAQRTGDATQAKEEGPGPGPWPRGLLSGRYGGAPGRWRGWALAPPASLG